MEVLYRLFKSVWKQCLHPESRPVNIYKFYDDVDTELLIGYRLNPEVFDILFSFSNLEPPHGKGHGFSLSLPLHKTP